MLRGREDSQEKGGKKEGWVELDMERIISSSIYSVFKRQLN